MAQGLSGPLSSLDNLLDGHMMSLMSLDLSGNGFAGQPRPKVCFSMPITGCLRTLQSSSSLVPSVTCPGACLDMLCLGGT